VRLPISPPRPVVAKDKKIIAKLLIKVND